MKTQTTLGLFISLIQTLVAEPRCTDNVADHPQPRVVPLLPLVRFMIISWGRQTAEQRRSEYAPSQLQAFRFSSSNLNATSFSSSCPSSSFGVLRHAH